MSDKKLSIIIVNFQSERFLEKCLTSIYEKIRKTSLEVIVVNNDNNEKLESVRQKFPTIRIIEAKKNGGFGAGNNLGAKNAKSDMLFFLNPDTEIVSGEMENILKLFKKNKKLGIVGVKLMNSQGGTQKWIAGTETNLVELLKNKLRLSKGEKIWNSHEKMEVDWVSGAALFIRKKLFEKLEGFDENFFMYFEDMDLCKRAGILGWKVMYYPKFCIKHKSGKSYFSKKGLQKKDYYKSQDYFFKKHKGKIQTKLMKILRMTIKSN